MVTTSVVVVIVGKCFQMMMMMMMMMMISQSQRNDMSVAYCRRGSVVRVSSHWNDMDMVVAIVTICLGGVHGDFLIQL